MRRHGSYFGDLQIASQRGHFNRENLSSFLSPMNLAPRQDQYPALTFPPRHPIFDIVPVCFSSRVHLPSEVLAGCSGVVDIDPYSCVAVAGSSGRMSKGQCGILLSSQGNSSGGWCGLHVHGFAYLASAHAIRYGKSGSFKILTSVWRIKVGIIFFFLCR